MRPAKSNVALLTEGQSYIHRAKKARREQIEEIKFDDESRRSVVHAFQIELRILMLGCGDLENG